MMEIRSATAAEVDQLARIWHAGWQDAHAAILPAALARYRTLETFAPRILSTLPETRVAGPAGRPLGFYITKPDELWQFYVSAEARGTGLAGTMLADAEVRLRMQGSGTAWLACAIGNERAARFYEKHDWRRVGNMVVDLPTPDGNVPLEVWRYEKRLPGPPPA